MRLLSNILERIESGSESRTRELLDIALGIWTAQHGSAHRIQAVSESRVAFVDDETNMYVGQFAVNEDTLSIFDVNFLCNVQEEARNHEDINEMCLDVVRAISEDREEEASAVIGNIMEAKTRIVRHQRGMTISEAESRQKDYMKFCDKKMKGVKKVAAKKARIAGYKASRGVMDAASKKPNDKSTGKSKVAMESLNEAAISLLNSIYGRDKFISETIRESHGYGYYCCFEDEDGKVHEKHFGSEEDAKECAEKKKKEGYKNVRVKSDDKIGDKGDDKDGDKEDKGGEEDANESEVSRSIIELNFDLMERAAIHENDTFVKTSLSWGMFRDNPIRGEAAKILEADEVDAKALLNECPWLGVCSTEEIYEAVSPHVKKFNPLDVRKIVSEVVKLAESEEAVTERDRFLNSFKDEELKQLLESEGRVLSRELDKLFLEGDGKFLFEEFEEDPEEKFGAAELPDDDLDDDSSVPDDFPEGDEDEMGMDDEGISLDDSTTVSMEMSEDESRELFRTIIDVIADEIQDNEEFDQLKAKLEDDNQELTGDDVTMLLQTIADYFEATGRSKERSEEDEEEAEMDDESLDDMDDIGGGLGDGLGGDTEGDAGEPGMDPEGIEDETLGA